MTKTRIQLTLFVEESDSEPIENIRREFNPEQYALIKSHVTLCREEELNMINEVIQNMEALYFPYITVEFGSLERFANGKGVFLPVKGDNYQFHQLRQCILLNTGNNQETHKPHITVMHPRNSTCTDQIFEQIKKMKTPDKLIFRKISLIEQKEGNKWEILREFELKDVTGLQV